MSNLTEVLTAVSVVGVENLPTVTVCICLYVLVKQKAKSGNDKS
jgi:hypothetical protein